MPRGPIAAPRLTEILLERSSVVIVGLLLAAAWSLAGGAAGSAALRKPLYTAGDRWDYVLQGALRGLPGMNASQNLTLSLNLTGIVEVDVVGPSSTPPGGVRAETHASGFLNGTFGIAKNLTIGVSGTFSSDAAETWEGQDYLPVASNSSTGYVITAKVLPVPITADLWLNATTSYDSLPSFNLTVGESATAPLRSNLTVATTFSAFGFGYHMENGTSFAGAWTRQVLSYENVTVEGGRFSVHRLNETLGAFPGIAAGALSSGTNETAWFSSDVGYYVKRVAYVNGTPVAEMRLKSFTYPAPPAGISLATLVLLSAVPIAIAVVALVLLVRRRRRARAEPVSSSGAGPVGELPPKRDGGRP